MNVIRNFCHIQMTLGLVDGSILSQEEVLIIVKDEKVIGTGECKDNKQNQCKQFKENLKLGDIVMVRNGIKPIAMVEIIGDPYHGKIYEKERSIRILELYKDQLVNVIRNYHGQAQCTLTILSNKNNPTSKFILGWYNHLNKNVEMKKIQNVLEYKKQIILQGPPGTEKTRLAKEIVKIMTQRKILMLMKSKN